MLRNRKELKTANKIVKILRQRGFIVEIRQSAKTKSVYLTIDNGAISGIRISDHINTKTKYKFNVIKNYKGKRAEFSNGKYKLYYNFNCLGSLIASVESERANAIIKNGYLVYKKIRDHYNSKEYSIYNTAA